MQPVIQVLYWNQLGRLLRLWRRQHLTDSHILKILRLYLGYEFTDLMDQFGRYPMFHFNEIRRRLNFRSVYVMIDDIRLCRSFYLAGTDEANVTSISSPLWHEYDLKDGMLLNGSMQKGVANGEQNAIANDNVLNNIYINTTVGYSDESALSGKSGCEELYMSERDQVAARHLVTDYFDRLERSSDLSQRSVIDLMLRQCMAAKDADGKSLSEAEAADLMHLMISTQLVPYFAHRQDFFSATYMAHPERRVYWISAFVKRYLKQHLSRALKLWHRRRQDIERIALDQHLDTIRSVRPLSPHEWMEPEGRRFYLDPSDGVTAIPPDMPPRPSPDAIINPHTKQWSEENTT